MTKAARRPVAHHGGSGDNDDPGHHRCLDVCIGQNIEDERRAKHPIGERCQCSGFHTEPFCHEQTNPDDHKDRDQDID